jgi:ribosome-associated heat shock protein Hsp15
LRTDRQRLDKWLWFARFARTRTLAAKLVAAGHVRVNGARSIDPAKALALRDVVTVAAAHVTAVVRVVGLGDRRGPAPEAQLLYESVAEEGGHLVSGPGSG